ncbi:extensin family protein [Tropicimonas sp. IMCC6043]|nr:extensin family protein [Tropicimonas sp. IMCC6043]
MVVVTAIRPNPRPAHPLAGAAVIPASARPAEAASAQPEARPEGFIKLISKRSGGYSRNGSVCGVNAIKGTVLKSFGNPSSGCGVANPVKVTSVAGVRLSTPATIDCDAARALNTWVEKGIKPAFGGKGGGVSELKVAAHYACRKRNNRPSGKLSEHAKGHAVDISAIRLANGTEVTVLDGWRSRKWSAVMRRAHGSACGPFGTVLGPNADGYHRDHFHVDVASYRSGPYCR